MYEHVKCKNNDSSPKDGHASDGTDPLGEYDDAHTLRMKLDEAQRMNRQRGNILESQKEELKVVLLELNSG